MLEKKKNRYIKAILIAVVILLIFLHYLGVLARVENSIFEFLGNIQNGGYTFLTKLKYSFVNYQEAQNLKRENSQLKEEVNILLYKNSELISYKDENEGLRSLLNFVAEKEFDYQVAKVIGKDINRANVIIINKGKLNKIDLNFPVVVDNGIMIGKIIGVKDNLAEVLLLTDKLSQVAVSTISANKTTGLAEGEYGLSIKMSLIPQDLEIKEGDIIITSGKENNIPRGLIIGKINRLISQENELFKSATISSTINYDELTIVSVIIPKSY
jgi:rod shape-determining protein MreC